jgi:ATP-binding cassette subfamily C protein
MKLHYLLFSDIVSFFRWRLPALILLMALVGLSEGLSVALLLPLLAQFGIASAANQSLAGALLDHVLAIINPSTGAASILAIVIAVAMVQAVLFIALNWWTAKSGRHYQSTRQSQLFRAFMRAKWEFLVERKSGELTNAIISESERLAQAFIVGLYLISTTIVAVIYLVFALIIAWPITLGLICCAVLMTLSVTRLYRKSVAVGKLITPLNSELQSVLGEHLTGVKIIKATTSEDRAEARIDRILRKLESANTLATFLPTVVRGLFEFLAFSALAAMFVFGKELFNIAPGNVIVVFALFVRLFPRVTTVQVYLHNLNGYLHALDAINQVLHAARAKAEQQHVSPDGLSLDLPTSLVVRDVDVKFGERKALARINLTVPIPGMIGIVGASGAGKSTLVHALLGLVLPTAGSISLGPYDLASVSLHEWRQKIGYVPQETILFHASVRENLTLANPSASDADIHLAAKRAHADDFIRALPQGYDTVIGDQGVLLSGGQRQRLGIARALLMDPIMLLMDEAMSALDSESEVAVMSALDELRGQIGILLIAHRLATIRRADLIAVLDEGRLVESGTWDDLVARRERLHDFIQAQVT